jgi:hypothetical protein
MVELGSRPCFAHESHECLVVGSNTSREDLQSHLTFNRILPGIIHNPHTATTDLAAESIVAKGAERFSRLRRIVEVTKRRELFDELRCDVGMLSLDFVEIDGFSCVQAVEILP